MPAFKRIPDLSRLLLLMLALCAGACDRQVIDPRFEVQRVEVTWSNGTLNATLHQKLVLSNEARNALQHGVPLTVQLELILRHTGNQTRVKKSLEFYEIRYLPLSDHFQLTLPGDENKIRTFPRLRHLLAELTRIEVHMNTGALPEGSYELMARIRMDKRKIPPPMRLPTLFSSEWRHDSDWSAWPLEIHPQA